MTLKIKTISIIGFGRFGRVLYNLFKDDFKIRIYDRGNIDLSQVTHSPQTELCNNLNEIYQSEVIFYALPISSFEKVIKEHKKYFTSDNLLVDVLSVKIHAKKVFSKYLRKLRTQALLTHPMFGPDSSKNGFSGLPIIIDKFLSADENYKFWKEYFLNKQLKVVEMSAEEHDELAAKSQGLTHFIGRLLEKSNFTTTPIDSVGATKLHEVTDQTTNDTWQLFYDLQTYNPFTKKMRITFGKAYSEIYNKLLPKQVNASYATYGIQGGEGSFCEQALNTYLNDKNIKQYKIKYLFTTENVLKNLHEGVIDYGIFAVTNSTGGIVEESLNALAKYTFKIVYDYQITIKHFLMKRRDVSIENITTIMAHPQVFAQCRKTLSKNFASYNLISGKGDLVDTAKAAQFLAENKIVKTTAILGPLGLAKKYNFDIIAENLQDKNDNRTRFLLVKR